MRHAKVAEAPSEAGNDILPVVECVEIAGRFPDDLRVHGTDIAQL